MPRDGWSDIFASDRRMHHYIGAVRGIGRLLQEVPHHRIPQELLWHLEEVLEDRRLDEPEDGFDIGHQVTWDAWCSVAERLGVAW